MAVCDLRKREIQVNSFSHYIKMASSLSRRKHIQLAFGIYKTNYFQQSLN
uniref:Uncharacterized protein n=1 Tax=Octopus bimaculoides TaxID=37653 RepID=A0A0L8GHI0_OCTBM